SRLGEIATQHDARTYAVLDDLPLRELGKLRPRGVIEHTKRDADHRLALARLGPHRGAFDHDRRLTLWRDRDIDGLAFVDRFRDEQAHAVDGQIRHGGVDLVATDLHRHRE